MEDIFTGFRWTGLTLLQAGGTHTAATDSPVHSFGSTGFFQLGIKFSGETQVQYNKKTYCYSAGTVLYLPKESSADIPYQRTFRKSGEGAYLFFDCPFPLPTAPCILPCGSRADIQEQFLRLTHFWENGQELEAMEVFYSLLRKIRDEAARSSEKASDGARMAPAIRYISTHLQEEYLDIPNLAKQCNMSPEHFRHRFREVYGVPPLQYFHARKCRMAEKLLLEGNTPIHTIAEALGFSSGNYFARFFKKHTGMTPCAYRSQYSPRL